MTRRLYVLLAPDANVIYYADQHRLHIRTHNPQRGTRCGLPYADLVGQCHAVPRSVICPRCLKPEWKRAGW